MLCPHVTNVLICLCMYFDNKGAKRRAILWQWRWGVYSSMCVVLIISTIVLWVCDCICVNVCVCVRACVCICAVGMWLCQDVPWGKALTPRSPAKAATDSPPHLYIHTHPHTKKTRHGPACWTWLFITEGNKGPHHIWQNNHLSSFKHIQNCRSYFNTSLLSNYKGGKCVYSDVTFSPAFSQRRGVKQTKHREKYCMCSIIKSAVNEVILRDGLRCNTHWSWTSTTKHIRTDTHRRSWALF